MHIIRVMHSSLPSHHHPTLPSHLIERKHTTQLTAFTSPKFPLLAKCLLKLAFALPAQTPHSARNALEKPRTNTRIGFGSAGDKQSSTMAVSLKMSASRR
jgi:hypothetical protein